MIDLAAIPDLLPAPLVIALGGLFGCLVGSFLNVVVCRVPGIVLAEIEGRPPPLSLSWPASHCPACKRRSPVMARCNCAPRISPRVTPLTMVIG